MSAPWVAALLPALAAAGGPVIPVPAGRGLLEEALARPLALGTTLALAPGEHVLVGTLSLNRSHSGVTLRGPDPADGAAVISGGARLSSSSWRPAGADQPGVWVAKLPADALPSPGAVPRQLWVAPGDGATAADAQRRTRARHPNLYDAATGKNLVQFPYMYWASPLVKCENLKPACQRGSNCKAAGCNTTACEACARNKLGLRYDQAADGALMNTLAAADPAAGLEAVVYHGWTTSRHYVSTIRSDSDNAIMFSNPSDRPIGFWTGRSSEGGQRYYVENAEKLLDGAGEFFVRPTGEVLYRPMPGEVAQSEAGSAASLNITAWVPRLGRAVSVDGATDVSFQQLTVAFSEWDCGGPNKTLPCDMQSTSWQTSAAIELRDVDGVSFFGVTLSHHGANALWVRSGANVSFLHSSAVDLGTGAIRVAGSSQFAPDDHGIVTGMAIQDSVLADGGHVFASGTAVLVQGGAVGVTVEHCEILEFAYTAISLGWSWDFSVQRAGQHTIRKNHIHHLGFPRREVGDAMACVYTLGQLNGTVVDNNLCHDVRAYMSGGYGLSQDQGSSNIVFTNNVNLRTTGSPHNTHYGVNLTYQNNVFWGGYFDCWVPTPAGRVVPGGVRTSPSLTQNCRDVDYPGQCPDQITFANNLIGQWSNKTAGLFEGDFDDTVGGGALRFDFKSNFYWSDLSSQDLKTAAVFGGSSRVPPFKQLTWAQWRALHGGAQDAGSALGSKHPFASDDWATTFNLTLAGDTPARGVGFVPIDTSDVGPRPGLGAREQ